MMSKERAQYFAKTLEKGIRVLNLFDEAKPQWSLTEIAERMQLNLTTVYRLVNTFVELGYLKKGPQSKILRLGPMAVALGNQLLQGFDSNRLIKPLIDEIHHRHNFSIDLSLFHSGHLVQVYKKESPNTLTYRQDTVSQLLYCTASGKSVLAFVPDNEFEVLFKDQPLTARTDKTITSLPALYNEIQQVRVKGYALNNEEYIKGLIAIAAPILNQTTGYPLGALSFTTTRLDHTLAQFDKRYAGILCDLAKNLAKVLPYG